MNFDLLPLLRITYILHVCTGISKLENLINNSQEGLSLINIVEHLVGIPIHFYKLLVFFLNKTVIKMPKLNSNLWSSCDSSDTVFAEKKIRLPYRQGVKLSFCNFGSRFIWIQQKQEASFKLMILSYYFFEVIQISPNVRWHARNPSKIQI